ncbi:MAG: hypothetical protein MI922_26605 [Bacteroidales bacterium]|nr:hypothetical protein [Bacteroidales bacterium]
MTKKYPVDTNALNNGFSNVISNTGLLGRWQEVSYNPLTICDTAHNEVGINAVIQQLKNTAHKRLHLILGFVDDKKVDDFMHLFPSEATFYLTESSVPRTLKEDKLVLLMEKFNLKGTIFNSVEKAFDEAKTNAGVEDLIFIGGSTFIVADFLSVHYK